MTKGAHHPIVLGENGYQNSYSLSWFQRMLPIYVSWYRPEFLFTPGTTADQAVRTTTISNSTFETILWQLTTRKICKDRAEKKKNIQQEGFAGGHPPNY